MRQRHRHHKPHRSQYSCCQLNRDKVVSGRPPKVLLQKVVHGLRQGHHRAHRSRIVARQNHVGRSNRALGSGTDGNPHIGSCGRRSVVDAIAHLSAPGVPPLLGLRRLLGLLLGANLGKHPVDAKLAHNGLSDGFGVTGYRGDLNTACCSRSTASRDFGRALSATTLLSLSAVRAGIRR